MDSGPTIMLMNDQSGQPAGYGDLIRTFLRISLLGFGGPNAVSYTHLTLPTN